MRAVTSEELDSIAGGLKARGMSVRTDVQGLSSVNVSASVPSDPWGAPGRAAGGPTPSSPFRGLAIDATSVVNQFGTYKVPANWHLYISKEYAYQQESTGAYIYTQNANTPTGYQSIGATSNISATQTNIYEATTDGWQDQPFEIHNPADPNPNDITTVNVTANQLEATMFMVEHEMAHDVGGLGSTQLDEAECNYAAYQALQAFKAAGG